MRNFRHLDPEVVVRGSDRSFYQPLHWKKPRIIFTCSMSDWFHPNADKWRNEAWEIIRKTPQHQYRILTKRPERINKSTMPADWWPDGWANQWKHVWLGVTCEMQYTIDKLHRMDQLRNIPCQIRWVSCEPTLDEITLDLHGFHLVVDGGETGPHARPAQLDWFRNIRDQCAQAKVSYVHLQNGRALNNGKKCNCHKLPGYKPGVACPGRVPGCRLLDGQLYEQWPVTPHAPTPITPTPAVRKLP